MAVSPACSIRSLFIYELVQRPRRGLACTPAARCGISFKHKREGYTKPRRTEEPPSYNDATKNKDAPPSYEQLFGVGQMKRQMQEAKQESSNRGVFAAKVCEIFCGSIACMICVLILAALPVAMIVIGSIYIDQCEGSNRIPIWLIVFGCVSLVQTFVNICKRCTQQIAKSSRDRGDDDSSANSISRGGGCIESFLSGFLFVWIIVGSVWVFSRYDDYKMGIDDCCCHQVPYLFSFIVLLVIYTVGALFCCCLCCCFCGLLTLGAASGEQ